MVLGEWRIDKIFLNILITCDPDMPDYFAALKITDDSIMFDTWILE